MSRTVMFLACAMGILSQALPAGGFRETDTPISVKRPVAQKAWIRWADVTASNWKPVAQPDLPSVLERARKLRLEVIAPGPMQISQGHLPYLCPNPDGKSWDMINPYHKKYRSEGQVAIHDFSSGETKVLNYGTTEGKNILTPYRTDFHMKPCDYLPKAQKMVFCMRVEGKGYLFLVYDPAVNDFLSKTMPFDGKFQYYGIRMGADEKIYGMGQSQSRDGFEYFIFDPVTSKTTFVAKKGPGQKNHFIYYKETVLDGDWLYNKFGQSPWHLTAFNFRTKEFRYLIRSRHIKGDHSTIGLSECKGGVMGHVKEPAMVAGVSSFNRNQFDFWLKDGKVIPRTDNVAPWSGKPVQKRQRQPHRFREYQRWPEGYTYLTPPPEIKIDASGPVSPDGQVRVPYRLPGQTEWKTVDYKVKLYPFALKNLIEIDQNTLFGAGEGYGQQVFYDLKKRRIKRHLVQRVSPYAVGVVNKELYVCGYPHFVSVKYDLANLATKREPDFLGFLGQAAKTHTPLAGLAAGADGAIYLAGTTYGRQRNGGGMAWYNPKTGAIGAKVLDGHRAFWLTSASKGRYIILSSKSDSDRSKIFCWDTQQKEFIYTIPSPAGGHAGPIEEVLPGLIIGHSTGDGGTLYGLEAATGKILWQKRVNKTPVTSFSMVRRHTYTYRRGPDGYLWATFGNVLVRIDPRNAKVIPVGKMEAAEVAFANNGVYVAGKEHLRRVTGLRVDMVRAR